MTHQDDRIHPATPARRKQAQRDGDFPKSLELAAAIQMAGGLLVAYLTFGGLSKWVKQATTAIWTAPHLSIDASQPEVITKQLSELILGATIVLAPAGLLLIGIVWGSHWLQTGPVFHASKWSPDPNRISPSHWLKSVFSLRTLVSPLVGIPKALLAVGAMGIGCYLNRIEFLELGNLPVDEIVERLLSLILTVSAYVVTAVFSASLLDYGLAWLSHQKRIRMTEQQLRDEQRMENGNPAILTRRKQHRNP